MTKDTDKQFQFHPLSDIGKLSGSDIWLGFRDPSSLPTNPGWPLRNLLALMAYHYRDLLPGMSVLCWRDGTRDGQRSVGRSLLFTIKSAVFDADGPPRCVGWEKNERGKMGPRVVNLSAMMDPKRLAESAVDLNLKLMKWRLLPEINLGVCHSAKCLLFGAGTLGCNVARGLMVFHMHNRLEFAIPDAKIYSGLGNPTDHAHRQWTRLLFEPRSAISLPISALPKRRDAEG